MTNIQTTQLVDAIATLFYIPKGSNMQCKVSIQVMMLPEQIFQQLFIQLGLEFQEPSIELIKLFFDQIVMMNLVTPLCYKNNVTLNLLTKEPKFRQITSNTQSASSINFQKRFAAALAETLISKTGETLNFQTNDQLCKAVNQYFKQHNQVEFWSIVGNLISEKNCQQLRDYYQKSFQKCMFQECISVQDKSLLCKFIDQMTGQKPSEVAQRFLQIVGINKYFKRNIIMYVVNRRQK
ncbi:Hypothetical_protein [Hexamita inflata]|uniref:Hypothetical_protein n=1 Tax=Hexamita inflata TaxID=28002 RepID=A0AA86VT07_9EUKA|nr:Hypothetical protein HINF_LOCUS64458 [Hexamita inflata]